ncbi:MAG: hypothetical protein HY052_03105 [Proteobacteria bacterium]|nr:hypothetical protein [Pseudomonadota bacterium]
MTSTATTHQPGFALTDTFNRFARKAVEDFPRLKNRFVFYSVPTDTWHGSPGHLHETQATDLRYMQKAMKGRDPEKAIAVSGNFDDYDFMAYIGDDASKRLMTSPSAADEQEVFGTLQHELGHLVCPGAFHHHLGENFDECVAEAFSFIRQKQKYHVIKPQIEDMNWDRSMGLILLKKTSHIALTVLEELGKLAKRHDYSRLTPIQTANLAYRLSLQYSLPQERLDRLVKIFKPVKKAYEDDEISYADTFKRCWKTMLEDQGEDSDVVFIIGKTFLKSFLEKRMEILTPVFRSIEKASKVCGDLRGEFWDDVRQKIKTREAQLGRISSTQRLMNEALDMQMLGRFDKSPDAMINPEQYESKENQQYLKRAREAYINLRTMGDLAPEQAAARAQEASRGRPRRVAHMTLHPIANVM